MPVTGHLPYRLILASASPARRELLMRAGYAFDVIPANIEEPSAASFSDARTFVHHTAWLKAAAVALRLMPPSCPSPQPLFPGTAERGRGAEQTLILAADTIGWLDCQVIGKPADRQDARRILRLLGGREHELWTGVCLWRLPDNVQIAWQEVSYVIMKPMTNSELEGYLDSRQWEGCSGAYAIEERDDPYVQVTHGSTTNVIGLPMETTEIVLRWVAEAARLR
jgi:septum formation protein